MCGDQDIFILTHICHELSQPHEWGFLNPPANSSDAVIPKMLYGTTFEAGKAFFNFYLINLILNFTFCTKASTVLTCIRLYKLGLVVVYISVVLTILISQGVKL